MPSLWQRVREWFVDVILVPEIDPHEVVTVEDPIDLGAELHRCRAVSARKGD